MEIIISTPENSSPRRAFGPFSQITQYHKKEKMPSFIQSDESLEKSNLEQKQQQSVGRYSTKRFQHTLFQRSSLLRSFLKPKFLKLILKQQIIQKFLNNLYQNAYIKRKDKNYITENYLTIHRGNEESIKIIIVEEFANSSTLVFQPGSLGLMLWDLIGISIIALSLWLCPFQVCFLQQGTNQPDDFDIELFRYFVLIIAFHSGIDFLISLNRGFICKGEMIYHRGEILKNYFRYTFFEELLNLLIWSLFYFQYSVNQFISILQMLLIFKQIRKKIIIQYEQFYLRGGLSQILDLINVILSVYFVAHTMACFWYYIGNVTTTKFGHSWLLKYDVYNETLWIKYAQSLYWATMTMVTVGYGDITAQNHYEIVASIVMMFISSCMFAYSMNSIGYILKVIYDNKLKYKKSLILINQHMSNNNIKKQLQSRIRNYLQYYYQEEKYENQDDIDRLYECLPLSLKTELTTDIQMSIIKQIKILSQFSLKTQQLLSQSLELQTYLPGDYVRLTDSSLYFLNEGLASIQEQKSNTDIKQINDGNTFGEYDFFTGFHTKLQVKAKTLCKIYRIKRSSIIETLKYNQKDFERYHQIKDEMIFAQNFQAIHLKCNFCDRFTHLNLQCPNNLFKPDIEKIIKQVYHQQQQPRIRNFNRKKKRSLNAVLNCQELNNCAKSLEENDSQKQASFDYFKVSNTMIDQKSEKQNIKIVSSNNIYDCQETSFQIADDKHTISLKQQQAMLDEFKNNKKINETTDIDSYFSYTIYRPQFNLENNIREYERAIKKYPPSYKMRLKQAGKYTIYYQTKVSIIKMKQILESP